MSGGLIVAVCVVAVLALAEQQADFAHAVLCLKSRVDSRFGTMRLKDLADAGDEDALRFLRRR